MTTENQETTELSVPERTYTQEQLEKMLPEYLKIMDNGDEEGGLNYLKEHFTDKPRDILAFAQMVADVVEDRSKDKAPDAKKEVESRDNGDDAGTDAGQTDTVEQA